MAPLPVPFFDILDAQSNPLFLNSYRSTRIEPETCQCKGKDLSAVTRPTLINPNQRNYRTDMTFATETGVTPQKPTGKAIQIFQGAKPCRFRA
jgi:hypothetical protein